MFKSMSSAYGSQVEFFRGLRRLWHREQIRRNRKSRWKGSMSARNVTCGSYVLL